MEKLDAALAAKRLNGCEYGKEGSRELFAEMRAAGLVAVFGSSDDLMEFRGAIEEEIGAWNGTTAYLFGTGLLENQCSNNECPYHEARKEQAPSIDALWDKEEPFSWTYQTAIPHSTFIVNEDGTPYCRGIVFALADVPIQGA